MLNNFTLIYLLSIIFIWCIIYKLSIINFWNLISHNGVGNDVKRSSNPLHPKFKIISQSFNFCFNELISVSLFAISDSASLLSDSTTDFLLLDFDSSSLLCFSFNTKLSPPECLSSPSYSYFLYTIWLVIF